MKIQKKNGKNDKNCEKHSKRETEKRSEPKNKAKHTDTERTNLSLPWIRFFFSSVVFFSHYFQYSFLFFF